MLKNNKCVSILKGSKIQFSDKNEDGEIVNKIAVIDKDITIQLLEDTDISNINIIEDKNEHS